MILAPWLDSFLRFGVNDEGSSPLLPIDLVAAVTTKLLGNPVVSALFTGGIYRNRIGSPAEGPYLIYRLISARPVYVTSGSEWFDTKIRFTVYAQDAVNAATLKELVKETLDRQSFRHARGATTPFRVYNESEDEIPKAPIDGFPYKAIVEFQANNSK